MYCLEQLPHLFTLLSTPYAFERQLSVPHIVAIVRPGEAALVGRKLGWVQPRAICCAPAAVANASPHDEVLPSARHNVMHSMPLGAQVQHRHSHAVLKREAEATVVDVANDAAEAEARSYRAALSARGSLKLSVNGTCSAGGRDAYV
mmetsp:Transcript_1833/g.4155  ORF Transcript_1833/g.4155 Transcript_1833/m.4155 type:complete len:147 (-) Transcript_1833:700-1140(-)